MDRVGVRQLPELEGGGEQEKTERVGCKVVSGAPTTLTGYGKSEVKKEIIIIITIIIIIFMILIGGFISIFPKSTLCAAGLNASVEACCQWQWVLLNVQIIALL